MMKVNTKQKVILATGGAFLAFLWGVTFVLRATTWLDKPPIVCKTFPTQSAAYPGKAKVCLSEIVRPWDEMSEDADLQISLWNPMAKVRTDLFMRVSIPIQRRKLSIFWRVERAQSYNRRGIQISEANQRYTSSHPRHMPADIIEPVWWWLVDLSRVYTSPRPDYETIVDGVVERVSRVIATVTALGLTIYRFMAASGEET
jgi:hypothetical protein